MNANPTTQPARARRTAANRHDAFELSFRSLFQDGRGLAFGCDAAGRIDLDRLSETARNSYLYARALIGRDYAYPEVRQVVV